MYTNHPACHPGRCFKTIFARRMGFLKSIKGPAFLSFLVHRSRPLDPSLLESSCLSMISNDTSQPFTIKEEDRGPWDIFWTCLLTIFLCSWTSICINVQSSADNQWDRFKDKLNLAVLCVIGPDFIILQSVGQWESAKRSVKVMVL